MYNIVFYTVWVQVPCSLNKVEVIVKLFARKHTLYVKDATNEHKRYT